MEVAKNGSAKRPNKLMSMSSRKISSMLSFKTRSTSAPAPLYRFVPCITPQMELNSKQIEHLRCSWDICMKSENVGAAILKSVVEIPEFAENFVLEDEEKEKNFAKIGERLEIFIDTLIVSLENHVSNVIISELCQRMGSIHFYRGVKFTEENSVSFQMCAQREILTRSQNNHQIAISNEQLWSIWNKFLSWITEQIRKGFMVEALESASRTPVCESLPELHRSISMVNPRPHTNGKPNEAKLSPYELFMIRASWQLTNHREFGTAVLMRLFSVSPGLAKAFGFEIDTITHLELEPIVQIEALRIYNFLDNMVQLYALQNKDVLRAKCERVGEVHLASGIKLKKSDISVISDEIMRQLIAVWEPKTHCHSLIKKDSAQAELIGFEQAWRKLIDFVLKAMQAPYYKGYQSQRTKSHDSC